MEEEKTDLEINIDERVNNFFNIILKIIEFICFIGSCIIIGYLINKAYL